MYWDFIILIKARETYSPRGELTIHTVGSPSLLNSLLCDLALTGFMNKVSYYIQVYSQANTISYHCSSFYFFLTSATAVVKLFCISLYINKYNM